MRKNPEEAVTQVLAALRVAEAPPGMERRILDAVHDRASSKSASTWRLLRPIRLMELAINWRRSLVWSAAVACTMTACLAIFMPHRIRTISYQPNPHATPGSTLPPAAPAAVIAKGEQLPSPRSNTRSIATNVRKARPVDDSDFIALRELRAASHPAPPMPLTNQERLLLRVAHKRAPQEFTALNPVLRATRDVEEKAEFQRFFEPPTTENNE